MISCNVGVKKDLNTGLKITNNGLTYDVSYLSFANQKTTDNEFPLDTTIDLIIGGIKGYTEKDSMVYIGASLSVFDKENKQILNYPDLFSDYETTGVTPAQAEAITLTLRTGKPMVAGESYIWKSKIWDKKGKGEINSEVEIKIREK